jgi:hypothetical protein
MKDNKPKKLETINYKGKEHYVRFKTDDFLLVSTKKKLTKVFCLTTKELEDDRNQTKSK